MIPKIIHLCWLSSEAYPEKIQKCLDSWKTYLPDWEIMLWDTKRFDINSTLWTKQAYEATKYAFAADYIRFYAVYNYGGVYLDSDIEILKSFNDLLEYDCFFGFEYTGLPEAAVLGAVPKQEWLKNALEWYEKQTFIKNDGTLNIVVAPLVFQYAYEREYGVKLIDTEQIQKINNDIIFPYKYFSVKNNYSGEIKPINNTYSIHHYNGAWSKNTLKNKIRKIIHRTIMLLFGKKKYNTYMYKLRQKKMSEFFLS